MTATAHAVSKIGSSRGDRGKRTIFYGYCTCGAGTTHSASPGSVRGKLAAHAGGDDRGMFARTTRPEKPSGAGLRRTVWNEERETWVSVYDGIAQGMDTDAGRWQVVCEKHGAVLSVTRLDGAKQDAADDPAEFCEECRPDPVELPNGDTWWPGSSETDPEYLDEITEAARSHE